MDAIVPHCPKLNGKDKEEKKLFKGMVWTMLFKVDCLKLIELGRLS